MYVQKLKFTCLEEVYFSFYFCTATLKPKKQQQKKKQKLKDDLKIFSFQLFPSKKKQLQIESHLQR